VLQFTSDLAGDTLKGELDLVERMLRESGRPLSMTVRQRHNEPETWRSVIAKMDAVNAEGFQWRGQVAPRSVGTLYGFLVRRNPFFLHPSYQPLLDATREQKLAAFRDPAFRTKLLAEEPVHKNQRNIDRVRVFDRMFALGNPPDYEPTEQRSILNLAGAQGRRPEEVAMDMLMEDDGNALIFAPASNYAGYNLDVCKELIESPHTCLGLSDGGAHVASISDANFPTWVLMYWGRDRKRGPRIDLPWLVHWMTGATARTVGLLDRGRIARGYKADLNVIDHDRLTVGRPYIVTDLPRNGRRMLQKAKGYVATILSGQVTVRAGEPTKALPGRLVRGQQTVPATASAA
jgi:N-acyl-D-aspartate/D-glutamate deacylase